MDVPSWLVFTKEETRTYLKDTLKPSGSKDRVSHYRSILAVRRTFSPVDMYCYLKARFGRPNGFQTFLAKDTSDNWIHGDFNLKVQGEDVCISGAYREIHFMLSEKLSDCDWPMLFEKIKKRDAQTSQLIVDSCRCIKLLQSTFDGATNRLRLRRASSHSDSPL
jgi:hypothetical protein